MTRIDKLLAAAALMLLASCGPQQPSVPAGNDSTASAAPVTTDAKANRVTAIQSLEQGLKDSRRLADLLRLPLPEEEFTVIIENDSFNAQHERAGRQLTRQLFLSYFPDIASSLDLNSFRELFRQIPPASFARQDSFHAELRRPAEPCYTYYIAYVRGDLVTFEYGSDHNDAYRATDDTEGDVCEFATIWTFRIEGSTLRFVSMMQAG